MASQPSVLYPTQENALPRSLFGRPTKRSYRAAVAQIVREVKARNKLNNEQLAEYLGCHEQTVRNAENEDGDLSAVTLLSVGYAFGEDALEPVRQLYLCAPPRDETTVEKRRRLIRELQALEDSE